MPNGICSVENCERPTKTRGWCNAHYMRVWYTGDVTAERPIAPRSPSTPQRNAAYNRWWNMIHRCTNPADKRWADYGGRGITVDPRWLDFETYYRDTGNKPAPGLSIDRINNDGPYSPENARWATWAEQARNQRDANALKTHCPKGHAYDAANTYVRPIGGARRCRACHKQREHERYWASHG